ncbi:hypothetical protein [Caldivirga maquilingensis]|uniref:Uncharacterized protein n=1 Tax=Caldivirga maquilingensis (strain ATCC 700844 / DSM 13496 / JCM 10307 / IC-167) TaxID=397948 RepID=A8MCV3_CALMQ|nr:hypothetical protein [Caldivirga maquilingensis]ABW01609.1 hypothetical protein Cmaq_0774 [Caldivirga maquilingensis IC-167]
MPRYIIIEAKSRDTLPQVYRDLVIKARGIAGINWDSSKCYALPILLHANRIVIKVPSNCIAWFRAAMVSIDYAVTIRVTGTAKKAKAQALSIPSVF